MGNTQRTREAAAPNSRSLHLDSIFKCGILCAWYFRTGALVPPCFYFGGAVSFMSDCTHTHLISQSRLTLRIYASRAAGCALAPLRLRALRSLELIGKLKTIRRARIR
jgi:hypothetical protein